MCGIFGICGNFEINKAREALNLLRHRGPDDWGEYISEEDHLYLGHRRLSIIDIKNGKQPIFNEDKTLIIIFNGCIYNYLELAQELRGYGHRFYTNTDTEVIVHSYEQWGKECVKRFNGMWAFVIFDSKDKVLFCSRDRLGIKPFYYLLNNERFYFSSEIKPILKFIPPKLNKETLYDYLVFQMSLDENTLFDGIKRLEPGHNIILNTKSKTIKKELYWDIKFNVNEERDEEQIIDRLKYLLNDAVRIRMRSDVPVGTHLSGGLDSSTIVAISRIILNNMPLSTFTGTFNEGKEFDETEYAKLVSSKFNTNYNEIILTPDDFKSNIKKIIYFMDEPAAGPGVFPQFFVSKLASEKVKVVLGGQGGDEIFLGYARYLIAYLEECLKGAIYDTADNAEYVATLKTIIPNLKLLNNYVPMIKNFFREELFESQPRRYFRLMNRFSDIDNLLSRDINISLEKEYQKFEDIFTRPGKTSYINKIQYFDLKFHLQALLQVEDRTSMAWGLESRVPFLDYRIVEHICSTLPIIKFKNGEPKYLLKKAVKNLLPTEIINRRDKMGFPVPLNIWAKNDLREFLSDILLSKKLRERGIFNVSVIENMMNSDAKFSRGLWGVLSLELFFNNFLDG
ncbi:MAG: asparagine synthase (glutamine-hydrolyzing) [Deltaproteobacteria bacterium]|nr:asparagine synthase (glutamine-hydrolyzing) [Deltaproteobacteria bacterium]